ncbi:MAG: TIGR02594 family protein [Planctomycetota bacterium]
MTTFRGPGAPGTQSGGRNTARIRARPDRIDQSTPETIADPRGPTPQYSGAGIQALAQVRENAIRGLDQLAAQAQAQRESAEATRKGVEREAALARARRYWQEREIELEHESSTTAGYRGHVDRFRAHFSKFRDEELANLGDVDDETRARIEVGYTNIETQFLGRAHKFEVERSFQQRDADLRGMRDDLIASSYTAPENYLVARGTFHAAVDASGINPKAGKAMKDRFDRDLLAGVLQRFTEPDGDAADVATAQSLLASGEAAAILGESTLAKWARRVETRRAQLSAEAFAEGQEFELPPARQFRQPPPPGDDEASIRDTTQVGQSRSVAAVRGWFGRAGAPLPPTGTYTPMEVARAFVGMHESRGGDREVLRGFLSAAAGKRIDPAETAWCAYWMNGVFAASGVEGTGSGMARSFLRWGRPVNKGSAQKGDVVVFSRGKDPRYGHVGFYSHEDADNIYVLAGNQGNAVTVKAKPLLLLKDS